MLKADAFEKYWKVSGKKQTKSNTEENVKDSQLLDADCDKPD